MNDRSRITGIKKAPAPPKALRRTRTVRSASVGAGPIISIRNGDELSLQLLRNCPREVSGFRHGPLHVSDLLSKCLRKIALSAQLHKPMPAQQLADSMGLTFAQGVAIHDYVKKKFLQGHPDKLYGSWSCLCGATVTQPMLYSKVTKVECDSCGGVTNRYVELDVLDTELDLIGSPDVVLYLADYEVYYPIEIKSITYDDWKEMVRPKPEHVLQVLFYWYLMRRAGYAVPDQVSIVYVSKGYVFKSPYKEFTIPTPSEDVVLERIGDYVDEARRLKAYKETGAVPPRTMCPSMSCKEAKECHVNVICFA